MLPQANLWICWWFSIALGVAYVAVFHLWMHLSRGWIIASGLAASGVLAVAFFAAHRRGYFSNHWDRLFHASVILDILLEALLIPVHDHHGFYLCALGFAVVLGGYRLRQFRRQGNPALQGVDA